MHSLQDTGQQLNDPSLRTSAIQHLIKLSASSFIQSSDQEKERGT